MHVFRQLLLLASQVCGQQVHLLVRLRVYFQQFIVQQCFRGTTQIGPQSILRALGVSEKSGQMTPYGRPNALVRGLYTLIILKINLGFDKPLKSEETFASCIILILNFTVGISSRAVCLKNILDLAKS